MSLLSIIVLAVVQGLAELLPVSSSAHVIVVGRALGYDPSTPDGAFLLVMLHTGTMFAVLKHFWRRWLSYADSGQNVGGLRAFLINLAIATICTGILGFALKHLLESWVMPQFLPPGSPKAEIEELFKNMPMIAGALFFAGVTIIAAGILEKPTSMMAPMNARAAGIIGLVQGLCLPFRGYSRSGATISAGMLLGISRRVIEDFSFALAVILTPPVIARELLRMHKASQGVGISWEQIYPGLLGMAFSFCAGVVALKWLSHWIDGGRWKWFGYYCIAASIVIAFF